MRSWIIILVVCAGCLGRRNLNGPRRDTNYLEPPVENEPINPPTDPNPPTDIDPPPPTLTVKRIFTTSLVGPALFSLWPSAPNDGLIGADTICNERAQAGGLSGAFVAWLSDGADDAYCRVHGLNGKVSNRCNQVTLPATAGPWIRLDGLPFAMGIRELVRGEILYPPCCNEYGGDTIAGCWTGTGANGEAIPEGPYSGTCQNWTTRATGNGATAGISSGTTRRWTQSPYRAACDFQLALVCLEIGEGALPTFTPRTGRTAFATSIAGPGNLSTWAEAGGATGRLAGDTICRTLATSAGLANSGNFLAWLSTSGSYASTRFVNGTPWVRLDGVEIAADTSSLTASALTGSISMTEQGEYVEGFAWTGTNYRSNPGADCNAWTSTLVTGIVGDINATNDASADWTDYDTAACDSPRRLYCLEN